MTLSIGSELPPVTPGDSAAPVRASRLRGVAAVAILSCVGMLVVSSLFASPSQRKAYRHAPAPAIDASYAAPPGQAATPGSHHMILVNGHPKDDRTC